MEGRSGKRVFLEQR